MSWTNKKSFRRTFDHSFLFSSFIRSSIQISAVCMSLYHPLSSFKSMREQILFLMSMDFAPQSLMIINRLSQACVYGRCLWPPASHCAASTNSINGQYYSDTSWYSIKSLPLTINWAWEIDTDPWQEYSRPQLVRTKVAELEWSLEISWQSGWERTSWLLMTFSIIEKESMNGVTRPLTPIFNWNQRRFANQNLSVHYCSKLLKTLVLH